MRNNIVVNPDKGIYEQGLSVIIFAQRTDRLNEWQMEFTLASRIKRFGSI